MYPAKVEEYLETWFTGIKAFFIEEELYLSDDLIKKSIRNIIGPVAFKNFIDNGDPQLVVTEEYGIELLGKLVTDGIVLGLLDEGVLDSFEDDKGEEILIYKKTKS